MLGALWSTLMLPFRIVAWGVSMLGRLAGLVVGFALMVAGAALGAGSLFLFGIPLFVVGLLITLRSLD